VEATQPTETEVVVAPIFVNEPGVVGAVVSGGGAGQAEVAALMVDFADLFPAASNASIGQIISSPAN